MDMDEGICVGTATDDEPALEDDSLTLAAEQVFLELDRREESTEGDLAAFKTQMS
jgi:hypothetical protein